MMVKICGLIAGICCLFNIRPATATSVSPVTPVRLTCELIKNPRGVDVVRPNLGYILAADDTYERGLRQTAYRVLVSSNADFHTGGDLWDSGKVWDDRMSDIIYLGKPLRSGQTCWWKVQVWDNKGRRSQWSDARYWTMGILSKNDWHAHWISAVGAEQYALDPVGFRSATADQENTVQWVQVDLGSVRQFSEVRLYPSFFQDHAGYLFPRRFKIEAADNPFFRESQVLADLSRTDFTPPRYAPLHIPVIDARARYVRLTVSKLARNGKVFAFSLRQLELWAADKNIAAGKPVEASGTDESDGFASYRLTDRIRDNIPNYSSVLLRKKFKASPRLVRAIIHVSGLSQYELSLNGKKIGHNLLSPGWSDYKKTVLYDTFDVTSKIKVGENVLGIFLGNGVYNIQPDTLRYVKFLTTFGPAKAIVQLRLEYADGTIGMITSDRSWQAVPGPVTYSNFYGGEDYDANLEQAGWDVPGYKTDLRWKTAIEVPGPGGVLKGSSSSAPPVKVIDTLGAVKVTKVKNDLYIYDFGQNASMMPALRVRGPKGSTVRMIPAELLGKDGLVDRRSATQDGARPAWWAYQLAGATEEQWSPRFFYQGCRYLQVELLAAAPGGKLPEIRKITDVVIHSSSEPVGGFECSNPLFNKIYNLVRWAQRSNMMSLMTDCPQREKMGWLEENNLNGPALRYNFNMSPLFRKTMNDMADAQLSNGLVPNIAPEYFIAGTPDLTNAFRNSPEWGSSFIIVPWQQYLFSGDISLLQRYYDRMKRYLAFLASEAQNNILYTGLGDWYDIGPKEPWGSQLTPVSFTATATYYYDNWIMAQVAARLGKQQDAAEFDMAAGTIKRAFNQVFYHPENGTYGTGSQTCSAIPLVFDLVAPENRVRLLDALVNDIRKRNNSFTTGEVGYRYLLKALSDGGRSDMVFAMNNQSEKPGYGYQLKMGATSLTEKWDAGVGNFGSQNHFMSGQINEWFFSSLVGLQPDDSGPGFRRFTVKPDFVKGLNWVKGKYASASGDIGCEWEKIAGKLTVTVNIPVNTRADLYLPAYNLLQVSEGRLPVRRVKSLLFKGVENGQMKFELGSGVYHFVIDNFLE